MEGEHSLTPSEAPQAEVSQNASGANSMPRWQRKVRDCLCSMFVSLCPDGSARKRFVLALLSLFRKRDDFIRPVAQTIVTCVVQLDPAERPVDALLDWVRRQTFSCIELILVARTDEARAVFPRYLDQGFVRLLQWTGADDEDPYPHLSIVSGEFLLEVGADGEFGDDLVERMVDYMVCHPRVNCVASDGKRISHGSQGLVRLRRNLRWGSPSSEPVHDSRCEVLIDDALRELCQNEGQAWAEPRERPSDRSAEPLVVLKSVDSIDLSEDAADPAARVIGVWFGDTEDDPYRFRQHISTDRHICLTTHRETAARLGFLAPRTIWAPTVSDALLRAVQYAVDSPVIETREIGDLPGLEPWADDARPDRIAIQVDDFCEGGMETVIVDLADALRSTGIEPCLLILGKTGPAVEVARKRGLTIHEISPLIPEYEQFLKDRKIELVNAHFSTFGADVCSGMGIPFVQSAHNMYMWFGPAEIARYQAADMHTRAYVCVSKNVARYSDLGLKLPPNKMIVIPNGVDAGHMDSSGRQEAALDLRCKLGLPEGARVFLNIASIHEAKAQIILVRALGVVVKDCPDAHLVLLGRSLSDQYYELILSTINDLGLEDRVHLVGHRSDVPVFHTLADALVMPSFLEGWSLAITEAVLAGLPVIATDVGGAVEQLAGTTGIVVRPEVDDLASIDHIRLGKMLQSPCNGLRDRIAEAMREVYSREERRSPLPDHWERLTRDVAYRRYAHVFRWLIAGGAAEAAAYWTEPQLDLAFAAASLSSVADTP